MKTNVVQLSYMDAHGFNDPATFEFAEVFTRVPVLYQDVSFQSTPLTGRLRNETASVLILKK